METMKLNCAEMESKLADLLLDPTAAPAKVRVHVEECESCQAELLQLQATMALMDEWAVPEPNPYFMTGRAPGRAGRLAGSHARPVYLWAVHACASAGGYGAGSGAAGGGGCVPGCYGC
jgi:hypothetical protein